MIRIEKRSDQVPHVLDSNESVQYRNKFIKNKEFEDISAHALYGKEGVANEIAKIFGFKCAYCEKKAGTAKFNIDHYRPKGRIKDKAGDDSISGYYWLAYSWDNLVYSCKTCNDNKKNYFAIKNESQRITFQNAYLKNIHSLVDSYNNLEEPYFIYPEIDQVTVGDKNSQPIELKVYFENFELKSNNERVKYTIDKCHLANRFDLIDERQSALDQINKRIDDILSSNKSEDERLMEVKQYLSSIPKDKSNSHFLFRKFIVKNPRTYIRYFKTNNQL